MSAQSLRKMQEEIKRLDEKNKKLLEEKEDWDRGKHKVIDKDIEDEKKRLREQSETQINKLMAELAKAKEETRMIKKA